MATPESSFLMLTLGVKPYRQHVHENQDADKWLDDFFPPALKHVIKTFSDLEKDAVNFPDSVNKVE